VIYVTDGWERGSGGLKRDPRHSSAGRATSRSLNHPGTPLDSDPSFETVDIDGAIDAVLEAPALRRIAFAVMSKTEPFATAPGVPPAIISKLEEVWRLVQTALVTLEPQTPHIYATGSNHYVQIHAPDLRIGTIRLIVKRARCER
jgi:hypothetical protein